MNISTFDRKLASAHMGQVTINREFANRMADRNFDDLADHFEQRIYGGSKGELRQAVIWRDLTSALPEIECAATGGPLRVLDVGGGLGHFSVRLSQLGHTVTYNDLSPIMARKARTRASSAGVVDQIAWYTGPYQELTDQLQEGFDLILCHALLEWLAEPARLIPALSPLLNPEGRLSFCFYNQAGIVYRNLIKGNFNWINNQDRYQANHNSLTPHHACTLEQVNDWLTVAGLVTSSISGIRVFSDYTVDKRGGLNTPESVFEMELNYSRLEPYKWLGRYLHIIATHP